MNPTRSIEMPNDPTIERVFSSEAGASSNREKTVARLRLLWNERKVLFRVGVYALVAFTVIAFLIPKRYESSVLLMPPDDQSGSGMMLAATLASKVSGSLAGMAGDVLGIKSTGDLFIGILKSRTVEDELIAKLKLKQVYGASESQQARRILVANTAIAEDRKSGIITITIADRNPHRAADVAGEYVAELNTVVSQLSTSAAHRERVFLEQRLSQVKEDLESAEKDFSQFASKNGAIDIKEQGRAMLESAATLEGELIAAQSELEGLKQIYSENNVRVRSLRARISELQNQLQQLGGKQDSAADAADPKDGELYPSIRKLPILGVPYADLYRRTRVQEAVFESLTQEYELAKVAEAKEIPSVKVLDPPDVPEHKSFPPRLQIMAVGTFFSLFLAILWLLGKERWRSISSEDPAKQLAQDVIYGIRSHVPWLSSNGSQNGASVRLVVKPTESTEEV